MSSLAEGAVNDGRAGIVCRRPEGLGGDLLEAAHLDAHLGDIGGPGHLHEALGWGKMTSPIETERGLGEMTPPPETERVMVVGQ